jgi:pilin isopeptide linkage protein
MPEGAENGSLTVKNNGSKVEFGSIAYTKAGTYKYTIKEVKGNLGGVTYDETTHNAVVTVKDNGKGKLVSEVKYDDKTDVPEFKNSYETKDGSAKLEARKSLSGRALNNGEFSFTLTAEDNAPMPEGAENGSLTVKNKGEAVDFGSIAYTKAGTYKYTIKEVKGNLGGVTYDETTHNAVVTVKDNGKGKLVSEVKYDDKTDVPEFKNSYETKDGSAKLEARKSLSGRALNNGEFSFTLTAEDNAPMPEGAENGSLTVKNKGEAVDFGSIAYTKAGTYEYTIKEVKGNLGGVTYDETTHNAVVTVKDNGKGKLVSEVKYDDKTDVPEFKNSYETKDGSAKLEARKSLSGRALNNGEFSFTLTAEDNAPMPEGAENGSLTVKNKGEAVDFGSIAYTKAGTYEYTIKEVKGNLGGVTYDETTHNAVVTVKDNGKGKLVSEVKYDDKTDVPEFKNSYETKDGSAKLEARKSLSGRALNNGEFSFTLTAEDNAPMPEGAENGSLTVKNKGEAVDFGSIAYTKAGTYEYTIKEVKGNLGGVTYDETTHNAVVTVKDNGKGKLVSEVKYDDKTDVPEFKNSYETKDGSAKLEATKKLSGRDLKDSEFTFRLKGTSENAKDTNLTAKNDKDGRIEFNLNYTKVGTYEYELSEDQGKDSTVNYDQKKYKVTVVVEDKDNNGKLSTTVKTTDKEGTEVKAEFANTIKEVNIPVAKEWAEGVSGESATIVLKQDGKQIDSVDLTEKNSWKHTFENLDRYAADGHEYKYTVEETNNNYKPSIKEDGKGGYVITNAQSDKKVNIPVAKEWAEGVSGESAAIILKQDGKQIDSVDLTEKNSWKHTFENLDKYAADGHEYKYTVEETNNNYKPSIKEDGNGGYVITNEQSDKKVNIPVAKEWAEGVSGESAAIVLKQDGKQIDSVDLTEKNSWKHTFENLDKYAADGHEYKYTVEETNNNYKATIESDGNGGYVITNEQSDEKISIPVEKKWEGQEAEQVIIHLYASTSAGGTQLLEDKDATLTADSGWKYTFEDLPRYAKNGEEIIYTIEEEEIEGYDVTITGSMEEGFVVTNTYKPGKYLPERNDDTPDSESSGSSKKKNTKKSTRTASTSPGTNGTSGSYGTSFVERAVRTGDDLPLYGLLGLLASAGAVMGVLLRRKKKAEGQTENRQ